MKECVTGTRLWSPVSARVCSSVGVTSRCSATAANEHLLGVREAEPAAAQQHGEVVEHVGGLLGHALVGLLARGAATSSASSWTFSPISGGSASSAAV